MKIAEIIRRARLKKGLSQAELAEKLGVSTGYVSNWENGHADPKNYYEKIESILDTHMPIDVGLWLSESMTEQEVTVSEIAEESGLSTGYLYNIQNGHSKNVSDDAIQRLANALGVENPRKHTILQDEDDHSDSGEQDVIGDHYDLDLENLEEFDEIAGVYIFWDKNDRPVYIGESKNIYNRIKQHSEKFWFREPVVQSASYIEIDDADLRRKVERTLISVLSYELVFNKRS